MKFLLPQGIGDSVWALHKIRSAAAHFGEPEEPIDVFLNCSEKSTIQRRAVDFVKAFSFVRSVESLTIDIHPHGMYPPVDKEGRYVYIPDGPIGEYFALMPNGPLERGVRLEDWLPHLPIQWDTAEHFRFSEHEEKFGRGVKEGLGEYCVFYLGPLAGNTTSGHNRGPRWNPESWIYLAQRIKSELKLNIVLVGAEYDLSYFNQMILPLLYGLKLDDLFVDMISLTSIGECFSVIKNSRFVISYQSGIGIFSSYMGVPTALFWRSEGDSISPDFYLSFSEKMAEAWANPEHLKTEKHMALIYNRHSPDYVMEEIKRRSW